MDTRLIQEIDKLRMDGKTWREIGDFAGVSGALVWKVAHGQCKSHRMKVAFGLSEPRVEVEPCICGEVHTQKTCKYTRRKVEVDRMAVRLSIEDGQQCRMELRSIGYASITDFWRDVANGTLDLRWFG